MPKKQEKEVKSVSEVNVPKPSIGEISTTFGNGEVNQLRDKINEVIRAINK